MRAWTSPCGGATPTRFRLSTVAKTRRICRASRCLSVLQPRRISQRRWQVSRWSSSPSPSRPCARRWNPHARPSCPTWPCCPWLRASNWALSSASTRSLPMPRVCPTVASPCSPARTCRAKSLSAAHRDGRRLHRCRAGQGDRADLPQLLLPSLRLGRRGGNRDGGCDEERHRRRHWCR